MNVLKEINSLSIKDKDDLDNLVDRLEDHQLEYGGLVRLRF